MCFQRFEPTSATQTDTGSSVSQQRHEHARTRDGDDAPSVADKINDRDLMMTQMIKLFLQVSQSGELILTGIIVIFRYLPN